MNITHKKWLNLNKQGRRRHLLSLQQACVDADRPVDIEPEIYSAGGVYGRLIHIPAGVTLVGEIHIKDQINVLLAGKIRVTTEDSQEVLEAPLIFVSPAGTKRAGYTLEPTTWITFLATDKTEDKDVYDEFIAPNYEMLDRLLENKPCHSSSQQQSPQSLVHQSTRRDRTRRQLRKGASNKKKTRGIFAERRSSQKQKVRELAN